MKKTLLVILAALLCLCMVIPAFADDPADTKGSDVEYTVTGGYEWSVPAKTTFSGVNSNQTLNGPVKVTKCLLEDKGYLTIRVGDDENVNDFKLKNEKNAEVTLRYEVVKNESNWVPLQNKDLILRAYAGEPANADGTLVTPVEQDLYGKIVEIPKVAGKYTDTITFVANCDTLPVDNLTGATWVGNDTIDVASLTSLLGSPYSIKVNFRCQSHDLAAFRVVGNNLKWQIGNDVNSVYSVYPISGKWKTNDGVWNIVNFTGDVTDSHKKDFIAWLHENGTLTPGSSEVKDLTGYQWTGKEESQLDLKTLFDNAPYNSQYSTLNYQYHYYKINFDIPGFDGDWLDGCTSCKEFGVDSGTDDLSIIVSPDTYDNESYTGYSGEPYRDYHVFVFTGGTDATNPDLIAWLQANGTLEKVN